MSILKTKLEKNNSGISSDDLDVIIQILSKYPEVEKAFVFGSRAKGNYQKGSDIDLCVKGKKITSTLVSKIHWDLEEETILPYFFDVVGYETISNTSLKEHIDRVAQVIYES